MEVGQILLKHGWVDWEQLALALTDQADLLDRGGNAGTRIRLCSMLVSRGVVDFDHASRALGERFGCAAVLRRHLERRDRLAASLLPTELARRYVALPIGRLGSGALIVCVRDPSPILHATLARAIKGDIVLAVAPASYVERLVARTYADVDVDIDIAEPVIERSDFDIDIDDDAAHDDIAIEVDTESEPVKRPPTSRPLPVEIKPLSRPKTEPQVRDSLDATIASFPDIDELEWLFDVVMGYVTKRWSTALLLGISDRRAVSIRDHGRRPKPKAFVLPLSEPSLVQLARDERRVVDEPPPETTRVQGSLVAALENAAHPVAAPILTRGEVSHVLVVGDPLPDAPEDTAIDLEVLAEAMGEVLGRI